MALLASHGVAGTGISELLVHAKVSRRSIDLYFPGGKGELIHVATTFAGAELGQVFSQADENRRPAALLRDFVDFWSAHLVATDFTSGCPIVAATLGRDEAPEAASAAGQVFGDWAESLDRHLGQWGVESDVAELAAITVVASIEGAVILSLARQSTEPLEMVADHLFAYIDSICHR